MKASFAQAWEAAEKEPYPTRFTGVHEIPLEELRDLVLAEGPFMARHLVDELYDGKVIIVRGAFTAKNLALLRHHTLAFMRSQPSSFHKMLEGSPNFHRLITPAEGLKYSFPCCKHSAYFYRWNEDHTGLRPLIYDRWRLMKVLMGLDPLCYELDTPRAGVVDRIQVVRYPPGIGFLAPHSDPFKHQRLFLSTYMSKRGIDYIGGGFYLLDEAGQKVFLEDRVEVGDMCIGYATVHHGVDACEGVPDWDADDGRWFLSIYSNASDEVANRHTGFGLGTMG